MVIQTKFGLGRLLITANARNALPEEEVAVAVVRHARGDWGELCREDLAQNELALKAGLRLLSSYRTESGIAFWIITEADRSCTTVLLPEDY